MMKLLNVILLLVLHTEVLQACLLFKGPVGERKCLSLNGYTGYQWVTCLPSKYISDKTFGRDRCRYAFANFCDYQCETEVNANPSGTVGSQCGCDQPNAVVAPTLDDWCYIPDTGRCEWYSECLQKTYDNCQGNRAFNTTLNDATRFCGIDQAPFSNNVKIWIDGVRRCLLAEMLLIFRMSQQSCQSITDRYITSLECCHLARPTCAAPPSLGSICTLNWKELSELLTSDLIHDSTKLTIYDIAYSKCSEDTFMMTSSVDKVVNLRFDFQGNLASAAGTNISTQSKELLTNFKCYNSEFHDFDKNIISYNFFLIVQDGGQYEKTSIGMIVSTNEEGTAKFNETLNQLYSDYANGILNFGIKLPDGTTWKLVSLSNCKNLKCTKHHWNVNLTMNMTIPQTSYCHINKTNFQNNTILASHSQVRSCNIFIHYFFLVLSIMLILR